MSAVEPSSESKRRGRRPAGQDTRTALLEAARTVFGEAGYGGATVRSIATMAGVDAAMVNHWFGSKEGLFAEAVLHLPITPGDLLSRLTDSPPDQLGEQLARNFLGAWDATSGGAFPALVRSMAGHEQVANVLRQVFVKQILGPLAAKLGSDRPELRATLCGSQLVGLGMARYVAKFEPLASTDAETLVAAVGPNLQRYLTGDLG